MDLANGDALLAQLRAEVERTRATFEAAKQEFARRQEIATAVGATHPDGSLRIVTIAYTHALQAHRAAFWRFSRFVLEGKLPDDEL